MEIDVERFSQFSDGDGNTAGTEIVAPSDESGRFFIAEESLKLTLLHCIPLLNLCSGFADGGSIVTFGGTCGSTDSVSTGSAPEQDDEISFLRGLSSHILLERGGDDGACLHSFGLVSGMVDFFNKSGVQADLISIGRESFRGTSCDDSLRQFSRKRFLQRFSRIRCACDSHALVDISTTA